MEVGSVQLGGIPNEALSETVIGKDTRSAIQEALCWVWIRPLDGLNCQEQGPVKGLGAAANCDRIGPLWQLSSRSQGTWVHDCKHEVVDPFIC